MASSSPYLKHLVTNFQDHNMNMTMKMGDFLPNKHHSVSPRNKLNQLFVSVSSPLHPRIRSLTSSNSHSHTRTHTKTEVDHHELLIQESSNGHTTIVEETETETESVGVQFQLQRECSFGDKFLITGDHPMLGLWDPNNAISLTWSHGHIWTTPHLDIPVGQCIKFKFIMQDTNAGKFVWQPGADRVFQCFQTQNLITLCEDWENPDSRIIIETQPTINQQIHFVEEPKGGCMQQQQQQQLLVSDEVVPVLVPGLVHESAMVSDDEPTDDEPESVNGSAMVSDLANHLTLPELDSKGDIANTSNSNPRPEISSINENQDEVAINENQDEVAEEQDYQAMISLLHNDIQWSHNFVQKFLNIFGFHKT